MHDGAPAHSSRAVRGVLYDNYHDRGGPTARPPRSPDLNPPEFYLWEHLNTPVNNNEALHHRTVDACQTIRNCPGIYERMWWSIRVEVCIESRDPFEHLL
jgi:hypothetical protein